jgi:hypothetical protein
LAVRVLSDTVADVTPGSVCSRRSTLAAHAAQAIPTTGMFLFIPVKTVFGGEITKKT